MMDIMNTKLKTDLGLKEITFKEIKQPKLKTSLPKGKDLMRVFSVAKGNAQSKGMSTALRSVKNTFKQKTTMPFKNNSMFSIGRIGMLPGMGNKGLGSIKGMGLRRLGQQKGLKPWGDYDGDKLVNILDCHPKNKFLQGPEHSLEDKLSIEDEVMMDEDPKSGSSRESDEVMMDEDPKSGSSRESDELAEERRKLEFDRKLFGEQKKTQAQTIQAREAEQRLKEARRKEEAEKKKKPTKGARALDAIGKPLGGAITTISQASRGFGGFSVSQQKLVGATGMNASQYKLLVAMGKAPPMQEVPSQPQQTAPAPQNGARQAQQDPRQGVYSPYSERRVSYVRGPYSKVRQ